MPRPALAATAALFLAIPLPGLAQQQVADSSFHYVNPDPAYPAGTGPTVCVDAGHENFHTLSGRYYPFGELLRGDGFRMRQTNGPFTSEALARCDVLVIASAYGETGEEDDGRYPITPAFTKDEISTLLAWIHDGGGLLLIADHSPWPAAAADLGHVLGFHFFEGATPACVFGELDESLLEATAEAAGVSADFLRARLPRGELGDHPITRGLGADDAVESVIAFGGSALFPADRVQPLLSLGEGFTGTTPAIRSFREMARDEIPQYDLAGWIQAGAVTLGQGRAIALAEAAMCTAQIFRAGTEHATPRGMNSPMAAQNPRFCLNLVRWLSGAIPVPEESEY